MRKLSRAVATLVALVAAALVVDAGAAAGHRPPRPGHERRPVVFVHGFVGSGGQFETQSMRFASNGYPSRWITALEYDSTFGTKPMAGVWDDLEAHIDRVLAATGADRVDLVGHSLGTRVSQGYLTSESERAAEVAHYVNLDGFPAAAPPAGIPTLAVWGEGNEDREVGGATNLHLSDQSHVQVASSAETFDAMYRLFTGRRPKVRGIVVERHPVIEGRVVLFPSNAGAEGARLEVWEVDGRTGLRRGRRPRAAFQLGADGAFGPFRVSSRKHYELAVVRDGQVHHFYAQPFVRTNRLLRLLTSEPGTGLDLLRQKSDTTATLTFVRYKELWGDQGAGSDVVEVDGIDVLTPPVAPRAKSLIGLFAFDAGLDGVTDLSGPIASLAALPFISGADVHVPAADPPRRSIRVRVRQRGDESVERINLPAWASTGHHNSVHLRDFTRDELIGARHGRGHGRW